MGLLLWRSNYLCNPAIMGTFNTLKRETGIADSAQFLSVAGAFNYNQSATLSVPNDCIEGNSIDQHTDYIADNLGALVEKKPEHWCYFPPAGKWKR